MVETTIRAVPAATPTLTNTIYINPLAKRLGDAYKDGFSIESTSQRTFLEILGLLGMGRKSQKVQVRDLKFHPMPAREEVEEAFKDNTALQLAARDSIKNDTRIFVEYEGRPIMLRATAIPSFLDRLRISGDVLSVIPKEMLAKRLNDYAQFTSGTALLIENNGKGEALLGQKYKLTPAEEIMDEAAQFFQGADFEKGLYSHSFVSATWRLGETKVQIPFDEDGNDLVFDQTVTVSTSDNCIVNGDLELIDEGKLRFEQLYDQENKVTVGERIVTSNISEKFVEGLFIGYVSEVQVDSNNLTKTGTIVTPVDFLHLKDVFVITVNKQDLVDGTAQVEGNSDSGSSDSTSGDSSQESSGSTDSSAADGQEGADEG